VAILDTFYILFKADSKDAEKSFKGVNDSIVRMDQSLNKFARKWLSLYGIFKGLTSAVGYAFELTQASQALNVNIGELDAWGGAVQKTGGTVEGFTKSLESMAEHLGTSPKIALQLLPKVADQFKRLNQVQALRYGKLLGLDTPTILLLQQGRREVEALVARQKQLGVVTTRNSIIFKHFQNTIQDAGRGFKSLIRDYILAAIPVIDKILEKFTEFTIYLRQHSGLIKGALIPIATVLGIIAAEMVITAGSTAILVGIVLALAAAFALAYDDIQTFQQGGDSIIGRMLERWPELGKVIKWVLNDLKLAGENIVWFFGKILDVINDVIKAAKLLDKIVSPYLDSFIEELKAQGADVHLFGAKSAIDSASKNPLTSQIGSSVFNNRSGDTKEVNITISEIQINTQATDPREIAYGLSAELNRQFRQTQNDVAGGVLI
jgi:hypothetical protein